MLLFFFKIYLPTVLFIHLYDVCSTTARMEKETSIEIK